jgi:hypothetical protein
MQMSGAVNAQPPGWQAATRARPRRTTFLRHEKQRWMLRHANHAGGFTNRKSRKFERHRLRSLPSRTSIGREQPASEYFHLFLFTSVSREAKNQAGDADHHWSGV